MSTPDDAWRKEVFVDLEPEAGGLGRLQARLRARQQWTRTRRTLAVAALALIMVLPFTGVFHGVLQATPTALPDDVALLETPAAQGPHIEARGGAVLQEVGRTDDIVLVRYLLPPAPDRMTSP